jgi:hypothetical protein
MIVAECRRTSLAVIVPRMTTSRRCGCGFHSHDSGRASSVTAPGGADGRPVAKRPLPRSRARAAAGARAAAQERRGGEGFARARRWHAARKSRAREVDMGRALEAVRTLRDLERLFGYFGLEVEPKLVEAHRDQIQRRFAAEVRAITRLCARLRERERFTIVREALRLSYESATLRPEARPA